MDTKYKRIMESLLEGGKLNDWESGVFQDIYDRDEQSGGKALSFKQKKMIDNKKLEIIDGITSKEEREKKLQLPTEYPNCKLLREDDGYYIEANGIRLEVATTKSEGSVILAYLSKALPLMTGIAVPEDDAEGEELVEGEEVIGSGNPPF